MTKASRKYHSCQVEAGGISRICATLPGHDARTQRVMQWFAPARFGLFHHWGLYTGGGSTCNAPWAAPLTYLHVTGAPREKTLRVQTNFRAVKSVEDLRTGRPVPFTPNGTLEITPASWDDVAAQGAAVFRVTMGC